MKKPRSPRAPASDRRRVLKQVSERRGSVRLGQAKERLDHTVVQPGLALDRVQTRLPRSMLRRRLDARPVGLVELKDLPTFWRAEPLEQQLRHVVMPLTLRIRIRLIPKRDRAQMFCEPARELDVARALDIGLE